jgi:hypothetical protein
MNASPETAVDVDVVVEGVPDLQTIDRIEAAVREAVARAALPAKCTIAVAPAKSRAGWDVGIVAGGRALYGSLGVGDDRPSFTDELTRMLQASRTSRDRGRLTGDDQPVRS